MYTNPRLVFEVQDKQPLTTATFSKFNARETKSKSPVEKAITAGKVIEESQFNQIADILDGYDKVSQFYSSFNSQKEVLTILLDNQTINQNDVSELFDENGFTINGKAFIESIMLGGIVGESQLRALDLTGMKSHRQKIVRSIIPLLQTKSLDPTVLDDLNNAITYINEARANHDGNLSEMIVQLSMFETPDYNINAMTMAIILQGKEKEFKEFSVHLKESLENQGVDLFGNETNKNKIYDEYREDRFTDDQSRIVRAIQEQNNPTTNERTSVHPIANENSGYTDTQDSTIPISENRNQIDDAVETQPQSENTVFTHEEYIKSRDALRKKINNLNSGVDPELIFHGIKVAGYHLERGARKFDVYAKEMINDFGEKIIPYLKSFYNAIRDMPEATSFSADMTPYDKVSKYNVNSLKETNKTNNNVTSTTIHTERDSSVPNEVETTERDVSDIGRPDTRERERTDTELEQESQGGLFAGQEDDNSSKIGGDVAITDRERSDNELSQQDQTDTTPPSVPRDTDTRRDDGHDSTRKTTSADGGTSSDSQFSEIINRGIELGDLGDIQQSLPQLYPEQQNDVLIAEQRFFTGSNTGKGMLFTNGTGTGKTYTGLGIAKRFSLLGKNNICIIVPTYEKSKDWKDDALNLDLDVTLLDGISDAGNGITVTTYANYQQNSALQNKDFDLLIYDECHYLGQGQKGIAENRFEAHSINAKLPTKVRAIVKEDLESSKPIPSTQKHETEEKLALYREQYKEWEEKVDEEVKRRVNSVNVVLLSATPFAYHKTLEYADGLLYEINQTLNPESYKGGYNVANGFDKFMLENFGYRMRYNKLTRPESGVDLDLMERAFHEKLKEQGVISGRALDIDKDYSRNFILLDSEIGQKINDGMNMFYDHKDGGFKERYPILSEVVPSKKWNYLYINQLLESIKASLVIPRIEDHLKSNRKVVLFHSYNNTIPEHPFRFSAHKLISYKPNGETPFSDYQDKRIALSQEIAKFNEEYGEYTNLDLGELANLRGLLNAHFGDRIKEFNGTVQKKQRSSNIKLFNDDNSGLDILLIQRQAGKEGISLHDTTGDKQRVLIDLGLPTAPTDAIQTEGRIYRLGLKSDAILEYPVIKTNFEIQAYASKIAERVRTPENLALGNNARNLENSFREGYNNADYISVSDMVGTGGKEYDKASNISTDFDRAKSYYYGRQKKTSKTKSTEGVDYFATPEPIGFKMVEWLDLTPNEDVLEPSAGHGAIARFLTGETNNKLIEPSYNLSTQLKVNTKGDVLQQNFETYHIGNKFDAIAMNPPYGTNSKTAMEHVAKAFNHLRPNGRLIAIVPSGPSMQKRLDEFMYGVDPKTKKPINPNAHIIAEINLPTSTFNRAGTSVSTKIIVIDNIRDPKLIENHSTLKVDLTHYDDVNKLFDSIENMSLPPRFGRTEVIQEIDLSKPTTNEVIENTAVSTGDIKDVTHSQTGEKLYSVELPDKLDKDEYRRIAGIAKSNNGYWSRFAKSFLFKNREDAEAFNADKAMDSSIRYRGSNNIDNEEVTEINNTFNTQLQKQIDKKLPKEYVYQLGYPNEILLSSGVANLPIELTAKTLERKANQENHIFEISDVKNLPFAIHNPIAVFDSTKKDGSKIILTEITNGRSNFIVALRTSSKGKGYNSIKINDIKSLYPKDHIKGLLDWISSDDSLLIFVNKEKALDYVLVQSTHLIGNGHNTQSFGANIINEIETAKQKIENFKNPTVIQGEKLSALEEIASKVKGKFTTINDISDLPDGKRYMRGVKGWYDIKNDEVVIVLNNNLTPEDVVQTYLHEVVGHRGMRKVFGKNFDSFLDKVYNNISTNTRDIIDQKTKDTSKGSRREATEEYIAEIAEQGFSTRENQNTWRRIVQMFNDLLSEIKLNLGFRITDNDLAYMLWKSYKNTAKSNGLFDMADNAKMRSKYNIHKSSLRYRGIEQIVHDSIRQSYERSVTGTPYKFKEGWIDSMASLKNTQEIIQKHYGKLDAAEDVYIAENALASRNLAEMEMVERTLLRSLNSKIAELNGKGDSYNTVLDYLYLKSGLERNDQMAKEEAQRMFVKQKLDVEKNADLSEEQKTEAIRELNQSIELEYNKLKNKDYSGITEVLESYENDNEHTLKERATEIVEKYEESRPDEHAQLWEVINEISNYSLKKSFDSGIINRVVYDNLKTRLKYYLPLRGWEEETARDVYEYLDSKKPVINPTLKISRGRESRADDPLATLINIVHSSISQGNRNIVKRKFYNMVVNHPTTLFTISKRWYTLNEETGEYEVRTPDFPSGTTITEMQEIVNNFEGEMNLLKSQGKAHTRKNKANVPYKTMKYELIEHAVPVLINGTEYHIYVNGNPILAQAMNGKTNPEYNNNNKEEENLNKKKSAVDIKIKNTTISLDIDRLLSTESIKTANRFMSANFTSRNPDFVFRNMSRDFFFSNANVFIKEGGSYQRKYIKNYTKNTKDIAGLLLRYLDGKLDTSKYKEKLFKEFIENGGETGYTNLLNIDQIKTKMSKEISSVRNKKQLLHMLLKGAKTTAGAIEFVNRCVEDISRFSTYETSRSLGRSIEQSVYDAKEVSVNFNKKGRGTKGAKLARLMYLFINPAMQGLNAINKAHKASKTRFYGVVGGAITLGVLIPMINDVLLSAFGDEEDKNAYYNLPDFVRRNNIVIYSGDKFITLPLSHELRTLYGLGEMFTSWYDGEMDDKNMAAEIFFQTSQMLPIDPVGNSSVSSIEDVVINLIPDMSKPVGYLFNNKDYFGIPIYKDTPWNKNAPEYTKAYKSTNKLLVSSMKWLNDNTGGDKYKSGLIDLNPASIEHLTENYLGGVYKFFNKSIKTIGDAISKDQEVQIRNIPIISSFIQDTDDRSVDAKINNKYFNYKDESTETKRLERSYLKEAKAGSIEYAEKHAILTISPKYGRMQLFNYYDKEIKRINDYMQENTEDKEAKLYLQMIKLELFEELEKIK